MDQGLYGQAELALVPEVALNLSRGCGNPTGFANIQPGDVVVDFGCGGGIDVILAAYRIGPQGRVVGIDLARKMIDRAKQAVAEAGLQDRNIELRVEDMERTELPAGFTDVVISNCVINLCPDKDAVYKEAFRILRPGGRLAISDIVLTENIDAELRERFQSTWAGCLGGAIPEEDYMQTVRQAGFAEVQIVARHLLTPEELEAMACCPGEEFTPPPSKEDRALVEGKVASIKFTAVKPFHEKSAMKGGDNMKPEKESLVTSGDIVKTLGVSDAKVKKAIKELSIEPRAKKGVCNYYSRDDLAKIRKFLGK